MFKKLVPLATALVATVAGAQTSSSYVEVGGVYARYDEPGAWFTSGVGNVKLGVSLSESLAIEAMAGKSLGDTNFYYGRTPISARIDSMVSGFVKFKAPASHDVDVFARLGFTRGQVSANTPFGSGWASGTSFSYGAGLQFNTSSTSYMNLDYMSYFSGSGVTVNGMGLNFGVKF
jgi:hypothetical protein